MSVSEHSIWVDADPEDVWRVYADPTRIPDWQTGRPVIEGVLGSSNDPGSSYTSRRGPLRARTTFVAVDRPFGMVTETVTSFGLRFEVRSGLEADQGGTRLTLWVDTSWPRGLGLVGRLVELAVLNAREQAKELRYLKELVEGEVRG